jgi:glycosyltransferase involved in cell wall biosynthesis
MRGTDTATRPAPRLSVVASRYNETACLPEFHRRATAAARATVGEDYEIVLVNDGSEDGSLALMHHITAVRSFPNERPGSVHRIRVF